MMALIGWRKHEASFYEIEEQVRRAVPTQGGDAASQSLRLIQPS